ncbi:MAG: hypothetical protein SF052_19875 [Bacteroidia bacterium]|nr:hypothetical protein [Bacteroidia bacterium]
MWFNLVLLLITLNACGGSAGPGKGDVIARFNKELLLREEVDYFTPDTLKGEDSIKYAQKYIEEWVRTQVIAEEAMREVDDLETKVDYKLKMYEKKLMENEFAAWLIQEKPDLLVVSDAEIRNYYNKYPDKFIAQEEYFQYFYISTKIERQYQLVNDMKTDDPQKIKELISWSATNAADFRLDSTYVPGVELDRIAKGFYFGNIRKASESTVYPYAHTEGETTFYDFFRLLDVINPGEQLPLSLCRDRIINIILNQRKNTLVDQTESNLIQQAKAAGKVTYY